MAFSLSQDPRAVRSRIAIQDAFTELMRTKPYPKITITDITARAGIARHTFYNHYETKAALLDHLVDSILEEFFLILKDWNLFLADKAQEQAMLTAFFQAWRDHAEIVDLLRAVDIEYVIMERLKAFFTRFFYDRVKHEMPSVDLELARYVISFNSYSLLGLLLPWFESGMKQEPQDLAGFYNQLSDSAQRRRAIQKYQDIFR
jgi:AcrR family transcriptional regulator